MGAGAPPHGKTSLLDAARGGRGERRGGRDHAHLGAYQIDWKRRVVDDGGDAQKLTFIDTPAA